MRSRWGIFLIALGFVSACASSPPSRVSDSEKAKMYLSGALGALVDGDVPQALMGLKMAESLDPKNPEIFHARALAYYKKNELTLAIDEARIAVKMKPDYSEAANTLGKLLMDSGNLKEAEKILISPARDLLYRDSFKAMTNLGILYFRRGEIEQSKLYLNRAIREAPDLACVAQFFKGQIESQEGNLPDAIRSYEKAVRRTCVGFADAHLALGTAYAKSKQYDLARRKFLEITQRFSGTPVAEKSMEKLRSIP